MLRGSRQEVLPDRVAASFLSDIQRARRVGGEGGSSWRPDAPGAGEDWAASSKSSRRRGSGTVLWSRAWLSGGGPSGAGAGCGRASWAAEDEQVQVLDRNQELGGILFCFPNPHVSHATKLFALLSM